MRLSARPPSGVQTPAAADRRNGSGLHLHKTRARLGPDLGHLETFVEQTTPVPNLIPDIYYQQTDFISY